MKTVVFITAKTQIDVPDDLVAKVANEYFNKLAPQVYADLLCSKLDYAIKSKQPITKDPVDVALFSPQMTIDNYALMELAQNEVPALKDLDGEQGELYEMDRLLTYSTAELSRLTGKNVKRPTLAQAKALCPPIVNVHDKHYQATLLGPISISNIMRQYKMFYPLEMFWYGDHESVWDGFVQYAEMGGPFIPDVPVTFISLQSEDRIVGNMMDLFLDRCTFNQTVSENLNVRYYEVPVERDPLKDVH
jgi:hypothetical protein